MRLFIAFTLLCFAACAAAEVASVGGCANAVVVPSPYIGQVAIADTSGAATYEPNVCNLNTNAGTYFYVITPTANVPMNISTCNVDTTFDTVLAVFQGDDCDSLQCVAGNDDSSCTQATDASFIQFTPNGGFYWVMVSGYGTAAGQFELSFQQASLSGLGCSNAVSVHGPFDPPVSIFDTLSGNTTQGQQPCNADSDLVGKWYIIYPTPNQQVTVTTCGDYNGMDTEIAVLVGPSCDQLECLDYSDDNCDTYPGLSTVVFRSSEYAFYYVYVTGYGTISGSYFLTISETEPAEDGCFGALTLPGPGTYRGQTNEDKPPMRPVCGLDNYIEYRGAWYTISIPPMTNMTITTCTAGYNDSFDSDILVFPSCGAHCIAFNDDAQCPTNSLASTVSVASGNAPTDYYIAVVGYYGTEGYFDLTVIWE